MTRFRVRNSLLATLSLSALILASPATAQETDEQTEAANDEASGNTILVTGLRRTDQLQDTPAK